MRFCIRREKRETKGVDQQWNVLTSFAQRRDFNGKHAQPVEKVLAKLIIADHALQAPRFCILKLRTCSSASTSLFFAASSCSCKKLVVVVA